MHKYETYVVLLDTCKCCESEVTEICDLCVEEPVCEACHGHYLEDKKAV